MIDQNALRCESHDETDHRIMRGRRALSLSQISSLALILGLSIASSPGQAAQANVASEAPPAAETASEDGNPIIVTGSRIVRDGFQAPTPVTVTSSAELLKASAGTIFEGLKELPQFANTVTSVSTSHQNTTSTPGTVLNLRGLGVERTLVLMDGMRLPPTYQNGTVDVDIIPQLLVQRVETATAGASAAYGSDAVAGAVNFILDRRFKGFSGLLQGGISDERDYENFRVGAAYGTDVGDRTHVILHADHYQNMGFRANERPQYDVAGFSVGQNAGSTAAPGTAANPKITAINVVNGVPNDNGIATSGPFNGAVFLGNGQFRFPATTGIPTGTAGRFIVPPGTATDLTRIADDWTQAPKIRNTTGFVGVYHELSDTITAFAQGTVAYYQFRNTGHNNFTGSRILSGNPYLPTAAQAILTSTNTASFNYGKFWKDIGIQHSGSDMLHYSLRAGLEGSLSDFRWSAAYQHGYSKFKFYYDNQILAQEFSAATDAVRDPATGNIVCAATLNTNATVRARYAGCVPIDPFGPNSISQTAADYVTDTSRYNSIFKIDLFSASISGPLMELWAGPLSAAVGFDYRRESLGITSNSDPSIAFDATGLRTLTGVPFGRFLFNNVGVANGSVKVSEISGEMALPLARDLPFAKSIELNGAARRTHYSTSGSVTTWKGGAIWEPIDGARFRLTRSRDIRAPNPYELFLGRTARQISLSDSHTNTVGILTSLGGGNPNLKPEVGDTLTFGVVLQPTFLRGFSFSIDYYKLKIDGAITTLQPLDVINGCEASGGSSSLCDLVTRPLGFSNRTAANFPTTVVSAPANAGALKTRGLDIEASYRANLGSGQLNTRLLVNRLIDYQVQDRPGAAILDFAGKNDRYYLPKWRGQLSVNYSAGPLNIFLQEQYIGKVKYGPVFIYNEPPIDPVYYTHATISYQFNMGRAENEVFFSVRNLFDAKAPIYTADETTAGATLSTQETIYDIVGRTFTLGLRVRL